MSSSQVQFFATTETVAHSSVHGVLSLHIYSPGSWLPSCISSASHSPSFPEQSSSTSHYVLVSLKLGHMSFKNIMIIIVSWPFVCSPGSISHLQADVSQRSLSSPASLYTLDLSIHRCNDSPIREWPISQNPKTLIVSK